MTNDYYLTTEAVPYQKSSSPVDPRDEAYTEACEENEWLKALCARAVKALESYPVRGRPAIVQLIEQLRKAAR